MMICGARVFEYYLNFCKFSFREIFWIQKKIRENFWSQPVDIIICIVLREETQSDKVK
jgi:hypothetical protein